MGFFDSLFGKPEPPKAKKKKKKSVAAATETTDETSMAVEAQGVSPEVVAAITASIYAMMGTGNLAVRITRTGNQWANVGRQKIMDSRQFA
ncbi:OadG family transporter subunit [Sporomusa sp.]|uniref:OadG family transporter subunit n=1 Tax=Sporomusa sp. TaxID=2078658 RepID=UPI002C8AE6E0|nr:OadG family transporter subunit [Sporomusa sp.]HWR42521.1 OadG family transporter subunit [Sporomusa sp.]